MKLSTTILLMATTLVTTVAAGDGYLYSCTIGADQQKDLCHAQGGRTTSDTTGQTCCFPKANRDAYVKGCECCFNPYPFGGPECTVAGQEGGPPNP
ncbi:unnamed protein product [Zymoseptoria tritici ST99CH_3D1]|nr:unnamed protein product [Zymoseptoria tritici ST99CH_3D1]